MTIIDTDVIVWALRGNTRAATAIDNAESLAISVINYMELPHGVRGKKDMRLTKAFLANLGFHTAPRSISKNTA